MSAGGSLNSFLLFLESFKKQNAAFLHPSSREGPTSGQDPKPWPSSRRPCRECSRQGGGGRMRMGPLCAGPAGKRGLCSVTLRTPPASLSPLPLWGRAFSVSPVTLQRPWAPRLPTSWHVEGGGERATPRAAPDSCHQVRARMETVEQERFSRSLHPLPQFSVGLSALLPSLRWKPSLSWEMLGVRGAPGTWLQPH